MARCARMATVARQWCPRLLKRAERRGEVLRIVGNLDEFLGRHAVGDFYLALLPHARDVGLPGFFHAANNGDLVQLDAVVCLIAEFVGGNLQLGIDLVDHRAGAAGALVVHGRNLLLAAGLRVVLEDDDLGILAAEFDDGVHLGVQLLDSK